MCHRDLLSNFRGRQFLTMMRSLSVLVIALLALEPSLSFAPLPNSVSSATSSTAVYFFGSSNKKAAAKAKGKKKGAPKEAEKKKEPFVFLIGKI